MSYIQNNLVCKNSLFQIVDFEYNSDRFFYFYKDM